MVTNRSIPAGEFKARCLALLDEVGESGTEITVTKRGRPVARLVPIERPALPDMRGTVLWTADDIDQPLGITWEAVE